MSTALITGASSGIGAVYARRFAARGHDLVVVARSTDKLHVLAAELRAAHDITVEVLSADLTDAAQRQAVETRLRDGAPIDVLVNNAGDNIAGTIAETKPSDLEKLVTLNVTVPTLLASAAAGGMALRGAGMIINIGSVVGFMSEHFPESMRRPSPISSRSRSLLPPSWVPRAFTCRPWCPQQRERRSGSAMGWTPTRCPI